MKTTRKLFLLLLLLTIFALPGIALAALHVDIAQNQDSQVDLKRPEAPQQYPDGDKLVLGGTFTLREDETLEGDLFVLGGTATLKEDSLVEGDVILMGGTLFADGRIEGEIVVIGGMVNLGATALVEGNVTTVSGNMIQDEGAVVEGTITENAQTLVPFVFTEGIQIPNIDKHSPIIIPGDVRIPGVDVRINPVWDFLKVLFWSFIWALLAVLLVLFLPEQVGRTSGVAVSQPLTSGGLGCLTVIIAPIVIVILAITICGIPASILVFFLLVASWAFGMIALGLEIGRRLAELLKQDWALPVSAAIGTFILTLVANTIGEVVPCIGWIIPALFGVVGLGAVLLTRFGTQAYPPASAAPLAPIEPVPPQVPGISERIEADDEFSAEVELASEESNEAFESDSEESDIKEETMPDDD